MKASDQALYDFLIESIPDMTDLWLSRRNKNTGSLYSSDASPEIVAKLREQNRQFNLRFSRVFIEDEEDFKKNITPWILNVSEERAASGVPLHLVIEQFGIFRAVIIDFVEKFCSMAAPDNETIFRWIRKANLAFDKSIDLFSTHYHEVNSRLISEKEKIIRELSAPVIPMAKGIGVLPLIGEIDIDRAQAIIETVLTESSKMRISKLFIDLSGVPQMDSVAAGELSKVIKGLNLLGVTTVLSGVRAEVAHEACVQGISFRDTEIEPDLAAALAKIGWNN